MSTGAVIVVPAYLAQGSFHRFSVDDYHRMISAGILDETDRVELLEGHLVQKMPHSPQHDTSLQRVWKRLQRRLPATGWDVRIQMPVTLADSEPEPDVALVRGDEGTYDHRHPGPADIGLLVEVALTSLAIDQQDKTRIYAQAGIVEYWIVNLIDRQVEVHTQPSGPAATAGAPGYGRRLVYSPGSVLPIVLDGVSVGHVPVDELLP